MPLRQRHARVPLVLVVLCACLLAGAAGPACAAEAPAPAAEKPAGASGGGGADAAPAAKEPPLPTQYGIMAEYGYAFDPSPHMNSLLARVSAIYDYGSVWHQKNCPNTLRFKVEGAAGSTVNPGANLVASANMLAQKYPWGLDRSVRPYGEAGIGVIYTEYRVKGQGLHFNFNPVLGAGLELPRQDGKNLFGAVRLYHLSNANLYHENRGVNYVGLQAGRFF